MSENNVQEIKVGDQLDGPSCHCCGAIMVKAEDAISAKLRKIINGSIAILQYVTDDPGLGPREGLRLLTTILELNLLLRELRELEKGWKCLSCGATTEAS